VTPVFFPSTSKGDECWWGTQDLITVYLWDTMEDQDRQDSLEALSGKDNWVVWKTKDNKWTHELQKSGFQQLLTLDKNTTAGGWGNKIKGWWRRRDIKVTKYRKIRECWVKSLVNAPSGAQRAIKNTLLSPQQNYGKDRYTIDLAGPEATYWLGTESGLLDVFHFDGACTSGDGSCEVASLSKDSGFCNLSSLK
jgi:hypothetical protein